MGLHPNINGIIEEPQFISTTTVTIPGPLLSTLGLIPPLLTVVHLCALATDEPFGAVATLILALLLSIQPQAIFLRVVNALCLKITGLHNTGLTGPILVCQTD